MCLATDHSNAKRDWYSKHWMRFIKAVYFTLHPISRSLQCFMICGKEQKRLLGVGWSSDHLSSNNEVSPVYMTRDTDLSAFPLWRVS